MCASKPFNEKWRYKTEVREKCDDMAATSGAYSLWEDDDIRDCAQGCLGQYIKKTQFLERNAKRRLKKLQENNPGLTKFMEFRDSIRGRR